MLGYRYWPGIFLAAFLVNLAVGATVFTALGIGLGNTLEAIVGAYLLTRVARFQPSLERAKDVLALVGLAAIFSTMVSATIGVTSLLIGGVITADAYVQTWMPWWVGDMLGTLVVAPLLLVWIAHPRIVWQRRRFAEALLLAI